ncbi:hypothetical protein SCHPADRAFT_891206 [Schizopora paradoxa]|uniref:Uncharacterized protein n=1 Tax=Schizopora paradoxa TaxID=27342 RepID=A0A0H2RR57_9AGAM|nr:hypothetical protein SCHPADRAFT_891206 [Schizopora paradoxa]
MAEIVSFALGENIIWAESVRPPYLGSNHITGGRSFWYTARVVRYPFALRVRFVLCDMRSGVGLLHFTSTRQTRKRIRRICKNDLFNRLLRHLFDKPLDISSIQNLTTNELEVWPDTGRAVPVTAAQALGHRLSGPSTIFAPERREIITPERKRAHIADDR